MRSLLVLLLCLSAVTQLPKQHTGNKQNTQTQTDKPAVNQNSPETGKPPETQFYTYNNQKPEGNETAKEVSDYLLAAFTLALVVVSIMQWRVLCKHEEWMEKHDANLAKLAESAKNNADAALLNAQAVVNSERPWVVVVLARGPSVLTFRASNEGRSPAVVLGCYAQYAIESDPNNLPASPHYGSVLPTTIPLLTPNFGHDPLGPFIDLYEYPFSEFMTKNPDIFKAIKEGCSHLVFWFKIVYTTQLAIDAKLPPYETCYCCEYSPTMVEELKTVGPSAYNKYT